MGLSGTFFSRQCYFVIHWENSVYPWCLQNESNRNTFLNEGVLISYAISKHQSLIQIYLASALSLTPLMRTQGFFCWNLPQEWQLRFQSETGDSGERTSLFLGSQFCIEMLREVLFGLSISDILYSSLSRHPNISQSSLHLNCCKPYHTSLRIYGQRVVIWPWCIRKQHVWDTADPAQSQGSGKRGEEPGWLYSSCENCRSSPSSLLCCICFPRVSSRDKTVCLKGPKWYCKWLKT